MYQRPGRFRGLAPSWLWLLMILSGVALSGFVVFHIANVAYILGGERVYNEHSKLYHGEGFLPGWLVTLGIWGLAAGLIYHTANGIRIASKPYLKAGVTAVHSRDLKHGGTWLWNVQVLSGSALAVLAAIHWGVIHFAQGIEHTTAQEGFERLRLSWWMVAYYLALLGLLLYHTANGIRSVLVKLGIATHAGPETRLRWAVTAAGGLLAVIGLVALAWFRFEFFR